MAEMVYKDAIQRRFERFHERNPQVYDMLVRFAREVKDSGKPRYGMSAIWERMRWHVDIEQGGVRKPLALPNEFRSRYSRLIMDQEDDLAYFFTTRQLTSRY